MLLRSDSWTTDYRNIALLLAGLCIYNLIYVYIYTYALKIKYLRKMFTYDFNTIYLYYFISIIILYLTKKKTHFYFVCGVRCVTYV